MINQESFYNELGRRIRRARKDIPLTQQQLAEALELNRTSITNIEKGKQKILAHTVLDLSVILKVPVEDLLPKTDRFLKRKDSKPQVEKSSTPEERDFLNAVLEKVK